MVKIYVNGLEIETERYIEEEPVIKNISGFLDVLQNPELPTEFEEFFQNKKNEVMKVSETTMHDLMSDLS